MDGVSWPMGPMASHAPATPASAPDTSIAVHNVRRDEKPAYLAASGAKPPTRNLKPGKLRDKYAHPKILTTNANTIPICSRVPGSTLGNRNPSENRRDCGKPKPSGSIKGPCTNQLSNSSATYTSISDTSISLALKRSFRNATMAAHAIPPNAPANSATAISTAPPVSPSSRYKMKAPAVMAPTTSWPSAPMLNTLARKHMDSPTAINSNGATLTPTSDQPRKSLMGS